MRNLGLQILTAARQHGDTIALRHQQDGQWRQFTYTEMADAIERFAAGLVARGIRPGDRVAIFSPNRPEWLIADYAIMSIRAVTVPVYATCTAEQVAGIVQDAGARLLLAGTAVEYETAREVVPLCPELETVGLLDDRVQTDGTALTLADLMPATIRGGHRRGDRHPARVHRRRRPRHPHLHLRHHRRAQGRDAEPRQLRQPVQHPGRALRRGRQGPSLCFLPLSHVYERTWSSLRASCRARPTPSCSDPKQVIAALAEVRPTAMASAPRLYEKIHAAILAKVEHAPPLRRKLFHWALGVGDE